MGVQRQMLNVVINIILLSIAIFVVAQFLPGVRLKSFGTGIKVAVVYSIIHLLLFKILAFHEHS